MSMVNAHIETTQDLDGEPIVLACFDLADPELGAAAHAVAAYSKARFRTTDLSVDDVLEMRELTAIADDLADLALREGMRTVVLRPARLTALRHALTGYVEALDEAEWIREEDREPLARVRGLIWGLADLSEDAMRAALLSLAARPS